jgi:hypothetical protein
MASEKTTEGGSSERGEDEMNGNGISKVVVGGGGAYRWKGGGGDAVQLKRRRVGLSNGGGSVSDEAEGNSSEGEEEQEEEEEQQLEEDDYAEEVAPEEMSDDYEGGRGRAFGGSSTAIEGEEDEEEEEEEEEQEEAEEEANVEEQDEELDIEQDDEEDEQEAEELHHSGPVLSMDRHRGASSNGSRGREPVGFAEEHDDDDYYEEEAPINESLPIVSRNQGRERDGEIELSSPEENGMVPDLSDDSEDERPRVTQQRQSTSARGLIERSQPPSMARASEARRREVMTPLPEKPPKGMIDTAKRKAPEVSAAIPRGKVAAQPKPKKEKAPAAPRKKANGEDTTGILGRQRFSTDNKARVTLERAREILAQVKAAMNKEPKHSMPPRHVESYAPVELSSSEDERRISMTHAAATSQRVVQHQQQVKIVEKFVKKRSRPAPKAGNAKEPAARKKKTKVEADVTVEEKAYYHSKTQQVESPDHAYQNGYSREDGYEQQQTAVVEKKARKRRKPKEGEDLTSATGIFPGSVMRDESWVPPKSPFGLIQESLYKDPWRVLLSCMLLNKTAGRQVRACLSRILLC